MKPKELLRHPKTDVDSRSHVVIESRIRRDFTIDIKLKDIGANASAAVTEKTPAVWILAFQAGRIVVQLRIGNARHLIGEFDVGAVADAKRRAQIVDALRAEGVIDAAEVAAFRRSHPDKARLAEIREAIAAKLRAVEQLRQELGALKNELVLNGG